MADWFASTPRAFGEVFSILPLLSVAAVAGMLIAGLLPSIVEAATLERLLLSSMSSSRQLHRISGQVPSGYRPAWRDEFSTLSIGDWSKGKNWLPYWVGWGVRHLANNNDEGIKIADCERLLDGTKAGDVLRQTGLWGYRTGYLHEVSNGTLKMRAYPVPEAKRAAFWGFPYAAGMISGERSFAQRYGYWETRIRLTTVSKGHHFAIWLLPDDRGWPPEIDILESVGQARSTFFSNTHGEAPDQPMTSYAAPGDAADWHVLGFEWTPSTMRWTVDGRTVRQHANYINDKSLYMLLSWEIGSNWPGDPDASTVWPAQVEVDYVRIYAPSSP